MRAIPSVEKVKDPDLRLILGAFKEALESLGGPRGTVSDRVLTVTDLVNIGLIRVENNQIYNPNVSQSPGFTSANEKNAKLANSTWKPMSGPGAVKPTDKVLVQL